MLPTRDTYGSLALIIKSILILISHSEVKSYSESNDVFGLFLSAL